MSCPIIFKSRGDIVRTYFDTGAMGPNIMHGIVEKAGSKTYVVRWRSGARNRVMQGYSAVTLEIDPELLAMARKELAEPAPLKPLDLDAIRARHVAATTSRARERSAADVPALLAEVERVRKLARDALLVDCNEVDAMIDALREIAGKAALYERCGAHIDH